jgi:hypothetical protein
VRRCRDNIFHRPPNQPLTKPCVYRFHKRHIFYSHFIDISKPCHPADPRYVWRSGCGHRFDLDEELEMNLKAKALLSAIGIAAAVASPAMAKSRHVVIAPDDAYGAQGYASPYNYNGQAQAVYGADKPVPPHANYRSVNPDFQLEHGN